MTYKHRFECPAQEMCVGKYVNVWPNAFQCDVWTVDAIVLNGRVQFLVHCITTAGNKHSPCPYRCENRVNSDRTNRIFPWLSCDFGTSEIWWTASRALRFRKWCATQPDVVEWMVRWETSTPIWWEKKILHTPFPPKCSPGYRVRPCKNRTAKNVDANVWTHDQTSNHLPHECKVDHGQNRDGQ